MKHANDTTINPIFHIHRFDTPIVCRYVGFEHRDIIYQCRCGKRKSVEVYDNYYTGKGFPIAPSGVSIKEYKTILDGAEYVQVSPTMIMLKKDLGS
jgi:hypothetical protein